MSTVFLSSEAGIDPQSLQALAARWGLKSDPQAALALVMTSERVELRKRDEPKLGAVAVDFVTGAMAHRRRYGGGRGEAVAKAVGIKGQWLPDVVDATAGLGRDAFVLACLGCRVRMFERHPVVAALLEDGLRRAYADPELGLWLAPRLTLHHGSSLSALVKKEMRLFQLLVGADEDADGLLAPALARCRVVVKRPDYAPPLAGVPAHSAITTKNHRFDLYPSQTSSP